MISFKGLPLRLLGTALAVVAAGIIAGFLANSDDGRAAPSMAPTFNPTSSIQVVDPSPGANSDIISEFGLPEGDLNFGAVLNFTPPDWGVARDEDIPDGALVAQLASNATLGFLNDGCENKLPVGFDLLDATTNKSPTVTFDDQFEVVGGLPRGVTAYPDYLTRIFEGLDPIARLYGQTVVGGIDVSLNFVLFEPGTVFQTVEGPRVTDPRMGYPSVTVLQSGADPGTPPNPGDLNAVSDFCSPLQTQTTTFGVTKPNPNTGSGGGVVARTNPEDPGTHNFTILTVSLRDADGDGYENPLDPCPFTPNPDWNPRIKITNPNYTGDADKDGLPDGCDPDPNEPSPLTGGVFDEDEDNYGNRADNCPLVPNGEAQDNQADRDGDGIGDACDPNPDTPDGERFAFCLVSRVDIGGGGPAPDPSPENMQPCDPNAPLPEAAGEVEAPTDTTDPDADGPATGTGPTGTGPGTGTGTGVGGPATGVGALAPAVGSIPAWAAALSALGGAGLLGSLGALAGRILGIRLPFPFKRD